MTRGIVAMVQVLVGVGVEGQLRTLIPTLLCALERVYVGEEVNVVKRGAGGCGVGVVGVVAGV